MELPASTGSSPSHLPTVSASSSSSLTCYPLHYSSLSIIFSLLCLPSASMLCSPAEPLLPWSLLCSRRKNSGWENPTSSDCGLTAKENGRDHQVLQAASFTLKRTLDQIKTGPPRILFPGETTHACWRYCFVNLYNILKDANRHQLWGVGTREADILLRAESTWRLSICHWCGGNHQELRPLKKYHQNKAPKSVTHLAQKCREYIGGYKENINKILNWSHHSSAKIFDIYCLMCMYFPLEEWSHTLLKNFQHKMKA